MHHYECLTDEFRLALELLDAGNAEGLSGHLCAHAELVHERVSFEGARYFKNPTLLQFIAENPVRCGTLPGNIINIATVILEAGAKGDRPGLDETLGLVCSGRVARECGVQVPLIDLLCDYGADPDSAVAPALAHGEFAAVLALLRRGACSDVTVAAGLGRLDDVRRLLPKSSAIDRHRALALAAQFGHTEILQLLLDEGENLNRLNPDGFHSHSTPLHQAVAGGHDATVRLLVESGARLDCKDTIWLGTPADWAQHEKKFEIERYLRAQETK